MASSRALPTHLWSRVPRRPLPNPYHTQTTNTRAHLLMADHADGSTSSLIAADFILPEGAFASYHRDGYYIFPPLLSASGLALLREKCAARHASAIADGHEGGWLMEVHGIDWLARLLMEPLLRPLIEAFCGTTPALASTQFFVKPPGDIDKAVVGWHQDGTQDSHTRWLDEVQAADNEPLDSSDEDEETPPPPHGPLTLWLPLDAVNSSNGGLRVLPRLHKAGALPEGPIDGGGHASSGRGGVGIDAKLLASKMDTAVAYELQAGQPAAHHPYTPHASGANTSSSPRRVLIIRLLPLERARWYEPRLGPSIPMSEWKGGSATRAAVILDPIASSASPSPPPSPPPAVRARGGAPTLRAKPEPKTIHVIRHGQAEHNVDPKALEKRNTKLTDRGVQQAASLRERVLALQPDVIITSPILRALQTTYGFANDNLKDVPVLVVPDARERVSHASHLCELPVNPAEEAAGGEFTPYDWGLASSALALAGGRIAEWEKGLMAADLAGQDSIDARGVRLSAWLEARPEKTLCLVSHGAFLMHLTRDTYFDNCELRTYALSGGEWARVAPAWAARESWL